ncbi:MAG: protein-export membrane protein SecF [Candidatus Zambryskibacteria bacterium RIFCSPLOWO2_02_FULL_51_21]|uniref:Protein-export membrane protein SecF n=1 Tax=Candidatus Zambryskibacteria bacterium RIFCSPHIGHO2_02_FULL_43_37 TaxID=1802749 RepID=A0A1G2TK44_9BACT|nr:MAG: protein-export membrane protein SecF [Candidatus Zambryskibacteria bacterium RIFCSPHIGHO2_02_FULL_43_37]OHB07246.1 MAG: protein-export membrane protein SecF [Candidatus Zambryskibacteria bacterium RIFCSPLOWO2_01_FULL_52_12]OHB11510.1 MAG: protein-export membrane protein SecF [Candidatus Zambryskibacteria bacterium RIFCSPLOWO2_02_FULL_51_21]
MFVIKYKKIWYTLSALLFTFSIFAMVSYGFNFSIDFKGGTITEAVYAARPEKAQVESRIEALNIGGFSVRPSGDNNYVVRTKELDKEGRAKLLAALQADSIERQNTIGPTAGAQLRSKALTAIAVVVLMIVLFITFVFRKVSKPVSSWKYGLATIIALAHDVIIPTGIFVYLGHVYGIEIDLLFVTGLLAILGYSVHDTIVVFDRVRENLGLNQSHKTNEEFETTVGKSVSQTFGRSINTSLTIFITLLALYFYGPAATEHFALLLTFGIIIGTYSSIFIASPLLVTFYRLQKGSK